MGRIDHRFRSPVEPPWAAEIGAAMRHPGRVVEASMLPHLLGARDGVRG